MLEFLTSMFEFDILYHLTNLKSIHAHNVRKCTFHCRDFTIDLVYLLEIINGADSLIDQTQENARKSPDASPRSWMRLGTRLDRQR